MAADYFLKIDGIDGESNDAKHKGEIELDSFSFGATQIGAHAGGSGGGAGKVSMTDFSFTMKANKSSPKLFLTCANGAHIKKATLTVRKAGKEQQEYYIVVMEDLLVSSYSSGGHSSSDSIPMESVSLNFAKINFNYSPQKADGTLDSAVKGGWNLKENKPL